MESCKKFMHPDDLKISTALIEKNLKKELDHYECEERMLHKNGSWVWVLDRGKVSVWDNEGNPLVMSGTHQEITERKNAEEKIRHMATHDPLTDLPGLRLAKDRILMAISAAHRYKSFAAVMFADLDGFKEINDRYGHDAGDEVLKESSRRFSSCVRETDTVARIGGDEFLIILTELKIPENAALIAEKVIQSLLKPFKVNGRQVSVSISMGIAFFPRNSDNPEGLIKLADEAMYEVKNSGKNGFAFSKVIREGGEGDR